MLRPLMTVNNLCFVPENLEPPPAASRIAVAVCLFFCAATTVKESTWGDFEHEAQPCECFECRREVAVLDSIDCFSFDAGALGEFVLTQIKFHSLLAQLFRH